MPSAVASPLPPARVVLMGMMGSGKSSIGRALSARTGWPYHDNDDFVVARTGRNARELLAAEGEEALRDAETAALLDALAVPPPAVVAVAAGTVLDEENRDRLRGGGFVVWLDAEPDVLAARTAGSTHRPWLEDDPAAWFAEVRAERADGYRAVADLVIDTGRRDVEGSADDIVAALASRG